MRGMALSDYKIAIAACEAPKTTDTLIDRYTLLTTALYHE